MTASFSPIGASHAAYHAELLGEQDRTLIEQQWRSAVTALPTSTVPALFSRQVALTPDAVAVETDTDAVSYEELDRRSAQMARRIADAGTVPGDTVAVLMERSVSLVIALLAIARAGAAYAPLDPADPVARMRAILAGVGDSLLLADATTDVHPVAVGRRTLRADDHPPGDAQFADATADSAALLYVMHTSGSTGTPKGVAVTHSSVLALALDRVWRGGAHERVLFHSPHAFDAATYELWVPLLSGGRVVIPPGRVDATVLRRLASSRRITALWLTAGLFDAIAGADPECLNGVREVWAGGDVLAPAAVQRVRSACPGIEVVNGYGPTETTTFAANYRIPDGASNQESVPIGTPMDNTRLYVLDEMLRLLPTGTVGELYIAGAGVARGYVGQPSATAALFLPDPYGRPGERMYATGDLARREPDGNLRFVGRGDNQVKISGFRIEAAEIEAVLAAHPLVSRAAVTAHKSSNGGGVLRAHVVPADPAGAPLSDSLLVYLSERLPAYMVPAEITIVSELPLTANGKVDRNALSRLGGTPARRGAAPAETTRSQAERQVAAVWRTVLGVDSVGPDDNFFDLGGNSLKLIALHARLCAEFGRQLPVQRLFENSTVRTMARFFMGAGDSSGPPDRLELAERGAARRGAFQRRGRG